MNNPTPKTTPFQLLLTAYSNSLNPLETPNIRLNKEQVLEILAARDTLQKQLEAEVEIPIEMWSNLVEQDNRLKQNAHKIREVIDLEEYRESLPISEQAWWWHLETRESLHPFNRFDGLFKIGKLLLLGVNFTLIGTIATGFLGGGSGLLEIGLVVFSTFISLLQTENALTKARQKAFVKSMKWFKVKEHWYEEIQFLITAIVFGILLATFLNFSWFSELYKNQGKELQSPTNSQKLPQLASAEEKYLKAITLDSDNLDAHYKLGTLYEELQDLESAKKQYSIAAKGGFLDAYNNLAYLYIRENKDAESAHLLEKATSLLEEKDQKVEQLTKDEKRILQAQKYSIFKNLGWARFKQNRNEDVINNLSIAKSIADNNDYQKYIRNPGAVFCIYAQVLEKQDKQTVSVEAKENWRKCFELSQGKNLNIEENQWLYEAKKRLK